MKEEIKKRERYLSYLNERYSREMSNLDDDRRRLSLREIIKYRDELQNLKFEAKKLEKKINKNRTDWVNERTKEFNKDDERYRAAEALLGIGK